MIYCEHGQPAAHNIYIKLRRSSNSLCTLFVCSFVCLFVSPLFSLGHFGQLLRYADKRIVNIMKVYIKRNNVFFKYMYRYVI